MTNDLNKKKQTHKERLAKMKEYRDSHKEKMKELNLKWRKENPRKTKAIKDRYENSSKRKAALREYRYKNKKKLREYAKDYNEKNYQKNRDSILERSFNKKDKEFRNKIKHYTLKNFKKEKRCRFCFSEDNLVIHHIVYEFPPKFNQLATLCKSCHRKLHNVIDKFEEYYYG